MGSLNNLKSSNNKYDFWVIANIAFFSIVITFLIVLLLPLGSRGNLYNSLVYKETYYDGLSPERQELYDKMYVSNAVITRRKTGTSFDSSVTYPESNMNGIDISPDDEYVKTNATVTYSIEVSIDANTDIPGVTDHSTFPGGVLKVRATVPTADDGMRNFYFNTQTWMKGKYTFNADHTIIETEYVIPETTNVVGAVQSLPFTLSVSYFKNDNAPGPTFEFWMEGNAPDNDVDYTSTKSSFVVSDTDTMKITAQEKKPTINISSGNVKQIGTYEGVEGVYWSIGINGYHSGSTGYMHTAIEEFMSQIELTYQYRDLNVENSTWQTVTQDSDPVLYQKVFGGVKIITTNANGAVNDDAYPSRTSNYNTSFYAGTRKVATYNGVSYAYSSGDISATVEGNKIKIKNENLENTHFNYYKTPNTYFNFYNLNGTTSIPGSLSSLTAVSYSGAYYFSDVIEIFVPYYTPEEISSYDLRVNAKLSSDSSFIDSSGEEKKSLLATTSNISASYTSLMEEPEGVIERFSGDITVGGAQSAYIYFGSTSNVLSTFKADTNTFHGEERLINIDARAMSIVDYKSCTTYTGSSPCSSVNSYYGIYKEDPVKGLTTTAEVNSKIKNDFYWYSNYADAVACEDLKETGIVENSKSCKPTSIFVEDYEYIGEVSAPSLTFRITANNDLITDYNTEDPISGIVRQKITIFRTEAHTQADSFKFWCDNSEDYYTPAQVTNNLAFNGAAGSPEPAGATVLVIADTLVGKMTTYDRKNISTKYYNVGDEIIKFTLKGTLSKYSSSDELTRDNYRVALRVPKSSLSIDVNSANVEPTRTVISGSYEYVIWEFRNCEIGGVIPGSCDGVDESIDIISIDTYMSPSMLDESSIYIRSFYSSDFSRKSSSESIDGTPFYYTDYEYTTLYVSNLSGSYARINSNISSISPGESLNINNYIYNNSQGNLDNVKTVQVLPKNGDSYGSSYDGSYDITIKSLHAGQKIYYTTLDPTLAGVEKDEREKLSISSVNLGTDSRWIEVSVGETIPSTATAIATYVSSISNASNVNYSYSFTPINNSSGSKYAFKMFTTSDGLSSIVATNTTLINVYDRTIDGRVFEDTNRNDKYDAPTENYSGVTVKLYNDDDVLVDTKTTDANGYYKFSNLTRDNYYVSVAIDSNHEYVAKNVGTADVASVINNDGKTDLITGLSLIADDNLEINNINIGIRYLISNITVRHYLKDSTIKLCDDVTAVKNYGETYTATECATALPTYTLSYYKVETRPSPEEFTVNQPTHVLTYYYSLKTSNIKVNYYIGDSTDSICDGINETKNYGETFTLSECTTPKTGFNLDYYELVESPSETSFTVDQPNYTFTYKYVKRTSNIKVHYYIEGGTTSICDDIDITREFGTTYTLNSCTTPKAGYNLNYYKIVQKPTETSFTVEEDGYEFTYYYALKPSIVHVHYYLNGSSTKICDDVNLDYYYGETYTTTGCTTPKTGYTLSYYLETIPYNPTGLVESDSIDVDYYYTLKKGKVVVHYLIDGTSTKICNDSTSTVDYGTTVSINPCTTAVTGYDLGNYEIKTSPPVNEIKVEDLRYEYTYEYALKKSNIVVHHIISGSTTKLCDDVTATKNFTESYTATPCTNTLNGENINYYTVTRKPTPETFNISQNSYDLTYEYAIKKGSVTIHYYIAGSTTKICDDKTKIVNYGDTYNITECTNPLAGYSLGNYNITQRPSETSVKVENNSYVYTYEYTLKKGTLTTHYYLKKPDGSETTTKVCDDVTKEYNYTDPYITTGCTTTINGVDRSNYVETAPADATGTFNGDKEVIYYYQLKGASLTVHHYLKNPDGTTTTTKVCNDEVSDKNYTDSYTTSSCTTLNTGHDISNYTITDSGNTSGTIDGNVVVTYYYQLKKANVTTHHYLMTPDGNKTITKVCDDVTKGYNYTENYTTTNCTTLNTGYAVSNYTVTDTGNTTGVVSGNVEVTYYYQLKKATLTVHHYLMDTDGTKTTTKVCDDQTQDYNYTENYTTSSCRDLYEGYDIRNYNVTHEGSAPNGTISGDVTVTYYYKLKTGTLTVHYYIMKSDGTKTTTKICNDKTTELNYTDTFEVNGCTTPTSGYKLSYYTEIEPESYDVDFKGDTELTYYYRMKTGKITVHHYLKDTTDSLAADEISTHDYGYNYRTSTSDAVPTDYRLASTQGTLNGTLESDEIEITYFYELKPSVITIHHYIKDTTTKLADDVVINTFYSKEYDSDISSSVPNNYEYYSKTPNYTGIVSSDRIEIIYYYQKKDSTLDTSISLTGTEEINHTNDTVSYKAEYSAKVKDYIGTGTITIKVTLPYPIKEEDSKLNGGTYNNEDKTITWTHTWDDIDTYNNKDTKNITEEFDVVYEGIAPTTRIMSNNVVGTIELDNNTRDVEDTYNTNILVYGKIIVHHYLKDTTEKISDDIETKYLVGTNYITTAVEIKGYKLVAPPSTEDYTYDVDDIEVIYYYERLKYNITTKVVSGEGTIAGDEIVFYGEDSSKDKIVIKAKEGYAITKIKINGKEQKITNYKKMTLQQIPSVTEDYLIEVEFEIENPNTGAYFAVIIGLVILVGAAIVIYKNKLINKFYKV